MPYLIYLYNEIPKEDLDLKRVPAYLRKHCSVAEIEVRKNFISRFFSPELINGLADAWNAELSEEGIFEQTQKDKLAYEEQVYLQSETISIVPSWSVLLKLWQFRHTLSLTALSFSTCFL